LTDITVHQGAVFSMRDPSRERAATTVESTLVIRFAKARKTPRSAYLTDVQYLDYLAGVGTTPINIPPKCDRATKALVEEAQHERQAEAENQGNANLALVAAGTVLAGAVTLESVSDPPRFGNAGPGNASRSGTN
jgi:hypothetical protein